MRWVLLVPGVRSLLLALLVLLVLVGLLVFWRCPRRWCGVRGLLLRRPRRPARATGLPGGRRADPSRRPRAVGPARFFNEVE